jgi:hypothetical protein
VAARSGEVDRDPPGGYRQHVDSLQQLPHTPSVHVFRQHPPEKQMVPLETFVQVPRLPVMLHRWQSEEQLELQQ